MIITNFATKEYFKAQERLVKSLNGHKAAIYKNYQEIGSPSHKESPYEFKYWAIQKAFEKDDIVIWLDSSVWLVGDISPIENIIKRQGYWLEESGHYVSRWCNDHSREYFKLTEQESKQDTGGLIMFSAGYIGFDKNSSISQEFLRQWYASAKAGCFRGSHENHRHDQTAGSIIAQRLGMKYERGGSNVAYIGDGYNAPEPQVSLYLQGMA